MHRAVVGARVRVAALVLLALVAVLCAPTAQAQTGTAAPTPTPPPAAPTWFEYRLTQSVINGGGAYDGWSDRLTATGRYEVTGSEVWARYHWVYDASDGSDRRGGEDRRVTFDDALRTYEERPIDLDDYDDETRAALSIWWRIPTGLTEGAEIQILDERFIVRGVVPGSATTHGRDAVLVEHEHGTGTRDDAYGRYTTTFRDRYWFDHETGWFLREERTEHDVGTLDGEAASFDVSLTVEATAASYLSGTISTYSAPRPRTRVEAVEDAIEDEAGGMPTIFGLNLVLVFSLVAGVALVVYLWRRKAPPPHDYVGKIEALSAGTTPAELASLSAFFGPMVPHLARQAQALGTAYVAKSAGRLEGLALPGPMGEAATIFASDTACCEALRQSLNATHFFSETRHRHAFEAKDAASKHGVSLPGEHAYNVVETYELLKLEPVPDSSYDREVVRRATAEDKSAIAAAADAVYGGTSGTAWISAAIGAGDVILVARDAGVIVGFAIVSVVGSLARFSGLTVAPSHRGRGLAKELNRARVKIAHDLGATRAIVEVAAWNVASLEIARASGFEKVGAMYIETSAAQSAARKFLRR